jgi:hypothetical protein
VDLVYRQNWRMTLDESYECKFLSWEQDELDQDPIERRVCTGKFHLPGSDIRKLITHLPIPA